MPPEMIENKRIVNQNGYGDSISVLVMCSSMLFILIQKI